VTQLESISYVGEAFVDDSGLGTNVCSSDANHPKEESLIMNLKRLSQEWESLLYSTGGALNLSKCFWFLLSWRWHNGLAILYKQTIFLIAPRIIGRVKNPVTMPRLYG
jgi:hypothetical protein